MIEDSNGILIDDNCNRISDGMTCLKNCAVWADCRLEYLRDCPHWPEGIQARDGVLVYPQRDTATGPDLAASIAYVGTRAPVSPLVRPRGQGRWEQALVVGLTAALVGFLVVLGWAMIGGGL